MLSLGLRICSAVCLSTRCVVRHGVDRVLPPPLTPPPVFCVAGKGGSGGAAAKGKAKSRSKSRSKSKSKVAVKAAAAGEAGVGSSSGIMLEGDVSMANGGVAAEGSASGASGVSSPMASAGM